MLEGEPAPTHTHAGKKAKKSSVQEDNILEQELLEAAVEVVAEMQLTAEELKVCNMTLYSPILSHCVDPTACVHQTISCESHANACWLPAVQHVCHNITFTLLLTAVLGRMQLGLRRLVTGEKDFCQVFQIDDQASAQELIVARANKYAARLVERADKELDLLPFSS